MTRRHLVLMRHGQAGWEEAGQRDYDRALTGAGRAAASAAGTWLRAQELAPAAIVSSPAPRAAETASLLAQAWDTPPPLAFDPALYEASLAQLKDAARTLDGAWRSVVLVGHNPSISQFADWLIGEPLVLELPVAGLAWLELPDIPWTEIAPGLARLRRLRTVENIFS